MGLLTPSRGVNLPSNMQDSRKVDFNFACPILREYTINWIKENAHAVYQPLYYLKTLESNSVNLCRTHYSKYLVSRKNYFRNTSVVTSSPPKLLPGTTAYNINEDRRKSIHYPSPIYEYVISKNPSLEKKRLHRIKNKCRFHLVRLDTCETFHYEKDSINKSAIVGPAKQAPVANEKRKRQKTSASSNSESETCSTSQNPVTANGSTNSEQEVLEVNNTLKEGNSISISIWNAPSLSNWELTKSNSQIDETVPRLSHLPHFVAADCLIKRKLILDRNRDLRSAITSLLQSDFSFSLPDNFGVRCVKDWNLIVDLDGDLGQFDTVLQNKHLDLYIGLPPTA